MKTRIPFALVAAVVVIGVLAGYSFRGHVTGLDVVREKATRTDSYCTQLDALLAVLLKDLETPNRSESARDATQIGADVQLSMTDLQHLRPCMSEQQAVQLPTQGVWCTKAFKNSDPCRINTLKKVLDLFPDEYRAP
jgi:hypothetical protein